MTAEEALDLLLAKLRTISKGEPDTWGFVHAVHQLADEVKREARRTVFVADGKRYVLARRDGSTIHLQPEEDAPTQLRGRYGDERW